jgi:hypothetical protein
MRAKKTAITLIQMPCSVLFDRFLVTDLSKTNCGRSSHREKSSATKFNVRIWPETDDLARCSKSAAEDSQLLSSATSRVPCAPPSVDRIRFHRYIHAAAHAFTRKVKPGISIQIAGEGLFDQAGTETPPLGR